jgi:hypothetical protein
MSETLVYRGTGTLTFGTGDAGRRGRRTIQAGEEFEVTADVAERLLADPNVELVVPMDDDHEPSKTELRARADELGLDLPPRATNAALAEAIAAEEQRLADEAQASSSGESDQGGEASPADDSGAAAADEAGTPPANTGAVTLGDLPDSAKLKG